MEPAVEYDGGAMDCGSGLLLAITARMRSIDHGQVMLLHTEEPSVLADLPAWARLSGHELIGVQPEPAAAGPWRLWVRRGAAHPTRSRDRANRDRANQDRANPDRANQDRANPDRAERVDYSAGVAAPLGSRLWLYSNFGCNLACGYCCAGSSPKAAPRELPVEVAAAAAAEFAALGGADLLITGGEPFLHPRLDELVAVCATQVEVTILTNAMVFQRGRRRAMLESILAGSTSGSTGGTSHGVTLQISLDSAGPELHDRQRGAGSHRRALAGIRLARELGFRIRVAATFAPADAAVAGNLDSFLADLGVAREDRLIRPVAHEGFAETGVEISLDSVEPEPTLTVDGAWWHPVGVTNHHLRVAESPLPLAEVYAVIEDVVAMQNAAGAEGRSVFRCT